MKIIHSSDLHLNSKYPERVNTLDAIIKVAKEEKANLLFFAGDFFDSKEDAEYYRPQLRKKFSNLPFKIYLIPGNHDYGAYSGDLFFGDSIEIITGKPFRVIDFKEFRLIAVPYYNQSFNEMLFDIKKAKEPEKKNILMLHCSIDIAEFEQDQFGKEESEKYIPVSSKILSELSLDYILAGHFHSRFVLNKISENSKFIYPGSPVSITKKETGVRNVALIDIEKDIARPINIESKYFDNLKIVLEPGKEKEILKGVEDKIKEYNFVFVELSIVFDGFTSLGEKNVKKEIDKIMRKYDSNINIEYKYRDIKEAISDPLYKNFKEKLEALEIEDNYKGEIDRIVKLSFSKIKFIR